MDDTDGLELFDELGLLAFNALLAFVAAFVGMLSAASSAFFDTTLTALLPLLAVLLLVALLVVAPSASRFDISKRSLVATFDLTDQALGELLRACYGLLEHP